MKCEQKNDHGVCCSEEATYGFIWPGSEMLGACSGHLGAAKRIATAMGFSLTVVPVELVIVARAEEAVGRLSGPEAVEQMRR